MPKSKPPRKKKQAKGATRIGARKRSAPPSFPDRRAMEAHLAALVGRPGETAIDAAQDIMYDAWAASGKQRVALARKALNVSPLCADAYVLLAEEAARSVPEILELYRKAVEAGEMALGEETFEHDVGHFWGLLETRPYMRARAGLAQALWVSHEREEAIGHYQDMLRLNPGDNQGLRYMLAACLLETERYDELDALLAEYDGDIMAAWNYTKALAFFRREGDTERTRGFLAAALARNGHVPDFLLGKRRLPRAQATQILLGGEDEAIEYVRDFGQGWKKTPGAVEWLRNASPRLPKPARGKRTR